MERPSLVTIGPVTGLTAIADELMMHLGYYPTEHPDIAHELRVALEDESLDLGRQMLAEHGLPVRDSVGLGTPA
ncbi:hypothetical protein ACH4T9_31305 [Micromonospora sp. NPDC020750]|uniref:hypothetical protein n=1 Tax=unclassified Micromonospora TaxID=2617518 RepID=UPI003788C18C